MAFVRPRCGYCAKLLDLERPYVCAGDQEPWCLYVDAGCLPDVLYCGPGCIQSAWSGGVTKATAARRPQGWGR